MNPLGVAWLWDIDDWRWGLYTEMFWGCVIGRSINIGPLRLVKWR